jgi:hypothetical protein
MALASRYRILSPPIAHQAVDGEVILINLENGSYYSLRGSGAKIWALLDGGATPATICAELSRFYERSHAEIAISLEPFLERLVAEAVIAATDRADVAELGAVTAAACTGAEPTSTSAEEYLAPELESFTDLQDLLLLDPIHQVGPQGWPRRT